MKGINNQLNCFLEINEKQKMSKEEMKVTNKVESHGN